MKEKVLCIICNKEFETDEETFEFDDTLLKYLPKMEYICPECKEDLTI